MSANSLNRKVDKIVNFKESIKRDIARVEESNEKLLEKTRVNQKFSEEIAKVIYGWVIGIKLIFSNMNDKIFGKITTNEEAVRRAEKLEANLSKLFD